MSTISTAGHYRIASSSARTALLFRKFIEQRMLMAGIKDIRTKSLRSNNPQNVVAATMEGLKSLRDAEQVAAARGIPTEQLAK